MFPQKTSVIRGDGMRITDEQIVAALLSSQNNRKAAQALGMTERSLYRRLQSEELQRKLRDAQNTLVDDAVSEMKQNLSAATAVIVSVMNNNEFSPQVRINAADMICRNYLKLSEHIEILRRLDRLEETL